MKADPEISLVIPAHNEEMRLSSTLCKVWNYLEANDYNFEIIVIDDGSHDRTPDIVREYAAKSRKIHLLRHDIRVGKGFSVKKGMLVSRGEYVIFSDADLSTPIDEIERMLFYLKNGHDVVFGSRALSDSRVIIRETWYRDKMGKVFGFLVRNIALPGVKDSQCGFKGFKRKVARDVFGRQTINGFAFDVEVLFIARRLGFRVKEIPVNWMDSPRSKVNPIVDSFKMLVELARIRLNDLKGKYSVR